MTRNEVFGWPGKIDRKKWLPSQPKLKETMCLCGDIVEKLKGNYIFNSEPRKQVSLCLA